MSAPIELLQRVPLFKGLSEKQLRNLSSEFTQRQFTERQELTAEWGGGAVFFVMGEDTAQLAAEGEARGTLGAGEYFGEIALIDGGSRSAPITATSDGVAYG